MNKNLSGIIRTIYGILVGATLLVPYWFFNLTELPIRFGIWGDKIVGWELIEENKSLGGGMPLEGTILVYIMYGIVVFLVGYLVIKITNSQSYNANVVQDGK
jgi:hypothetical protein